MIFLQFFLIKAARNLDIFIGGSSLAQLVEGNLCKKLLVLADFWYENQRNTF
jgi:hypothetical protein